MTGKPDEAELRRKLAECWKGLVKIVAIGCKDVPWCKPVEAKHSIYCPEGIARAALAAAGLAAERQP